ncbi:MAG TPA: aminotransferase class V-fold PLP-dependent enzyme [Herpetosiphonaceae bacterium]
MNADHVRMVRAALAAVASSVYLNTGTAGPLPRAALDALITESQHDFERGRADIIAYERVLKTFEELRAAFAGLLGAATDEIAITHHTSEGMNIGCWGLNWQPGDELLLTNLEHEGGLLPAYAAAQRFGVDVRVADLGLGDDPAAVLAALDAAITPRTRLLSISHVSWSSGACLPLSEIVALAHRRGVLVLVDGAQSVGAIPLDLHALKVDFYAIPGQKWLCGPEGVGALYVRRDRISLLRPTFVSFFSLRDSESYTLSGDALYAPGARRYEVGTIFRPGLYAMLASLRWLESSVGWHWAFERIQHLADRGRALLGALPGATILTPDSHAGLVAFTVESLDPATTAEKLRAQGIIIRTIPLSDSYVLRISTGFYNTEEELLRLRDALAALIERRD